MPGTLVVPANLICSHSMNFTHETVPHTIKVSRTCTILRPADELFRFWRKLSNLPQIMPHLVSVTETSPTRSHWVVQGPLASQVEWDAEIINEVTGELLAWQTVDSPRVDHAGSIRFEPTLGGRATIVRVTLGYHPPGGKLGDMVAKLFGDDPGLMIDDELLRFKSLMETGDTSQLSRSVPTPLAVT